MLRFDDRVWILWALWILLLPLKWLVASAAAMLIHEMCHIAAVLLLGGKIYSLTVAPFGAVIEMGAMHSLRELVCALSGPVGSLSLVFLIRIFPVLGLCGLVHGLFNLLPVYPMDGGRALRCVLDYYLPQYADLLCKWVERILLILVLCTLGYFIFRYALGIYPFALCIFALVSAILRKRP